MINKLNIILIVFLSILFSYFFMETYKSRKNLDYFYYKIVIQNSVETKFSPAKKDILNKIYDTLIEIIVNNHDLSLYDRYPDMNKFREEITFDDRSGENIIQEKKQGLIISRYKINLSQFIEQYNKSTTKLNCEIRNYNNCRYYSSLLEKYSDEKRYINFFNKNVNQIEIKNIKNEIYFLRVFLILSFIFSIVFLFFKKQE